MRFAAIATAALLATLILAGCSGSNSDLGSQTTTSAKPSTGSGAMSAPTAAPSSSAPSSSAPTSSSSPPARTIGLAADRLDGAAPLNVNFTVSAQGETPTSFTLAFGDNEISDGSSFPAVVEHSYVESGSYIPKLTATYSDGAKLERTLSLAVTPPTVVGTSAPLYNKTFAPKFQAAGPALYTGILCGENPQLDPTQCEDLQAKWAYDNGLNGTYVVGYEVPVAAGAISIFLEGGTMEAQTCVPMLICTPDFDLYAFDPAGVSNPVASTAPFESGIVEFPIPGIWTVLVVYYSGPPQATASLHIVVR